MQESPASIPSVSQSLAVSQEWKKERGDHSLPASTYPTTEAGAARVRRSEGTCLPGKSRATPLGLGAGHWELDRNALGTLLRSFANVSQIFRPHQNSSLTQGYSKHPSHHVYEEFLHLLLDSVCPWALASLTEQREAGTCQPCHACVPHPHPPQNQREQTKPMNIKVL